MKAKSCLALFALFFISITDYGQTKSNDVKVFWGEEVKASKKLTLSEVLGYDKTGYYMLAREGRDLLIEKYDKNLGPAGSEEIEIKKDKTVKNREFEFIIYFNQKIYLFSSADNRHDKSNTLYVQTVDKNSLKPNDDVKSICSITYESKRNDGSFSCRVSRDSSKLLIYYQLPYKKKDYEQYGFQAYDLNLKKLWENEVTLPYMDQLFSVDKVSVDDEGNAYVLGKLYKDKVKEKVKGKANYDYHIFAYMNGGKDNKEYTCQIPEKFITDISFTVSNSGELICAGFYSDKFTNAARGCFYMDIDPKTKTVKATNLKEFSMDFLTQYVSEKDQKKMEKKAAKGEEPELPSYDIDKLILRDDGGVLVVGEQYWIEVVSTYVPGPNGGGSYRTTYYYHYNDIIVININAKGVIEWAQKIPKVQLSQNDGGFYSSYALSIKDDKLYFIFNDSKDNYNLKPGAAFKNFEFGKDALVTMVTMDKSGNTKREALFGHEDVEIITRPKVCEQISPNEMLIYGQKKKAHQFAKLTFF
jgi:hypothetical protein